MTEPEDNDPAAILLTRIRPAAPSADLMERLFAARPGALAPPVRETAPVSKSRIVRFLPHFAATAAAFVIAGAIAWFVLPRDTAAPEVATTPQPAPAAPKPGVAFRYLDPQESRQELLGVRDLGFARDAQSRPVRLMHATWVDDNTYSQGDGTPPVRESRVRDEILPVVLTTY